MINSVKVNDRDISNFKFHRVCERKSGRLRKFWRSCKKKCIHYSAISFQCKRCQFYKLNISQLVMNRLRSISLSFVFVFLLLVPISPLNVNNQILIGVQISPRFLKNYNQLLWFMQYIIISILPTISNERYTSLFLKMSL